MLSEEEMKRLDDLRKIRDGMSWGSADQGIAQLSENELFLLSLIEKLTKNS